MEIDFSKYDATTTDSEAVMLGQIPIDESHDVTFDQVVEVAEGSLLANVTTDLDGDVLWLWSSEYGGQNGFASLRKAAGGAGKIEGNTFTYTRVSSKKSPLGYAHRWTA